MKLEVKDASFYYDKERTLFENLSFTLDRGQVLAILGPNGAGKTSLIRCICGFDEWRNGTSYIDNENINKINYKKLWSKLSYVPQKRFFNFSYTGLEMVVLGLGNSMGIFSKPNKKDYSKAKKIMQDLGIENLVDKICTIMSGGEIQMVLMARALISEPELIILDEPETGLDFKNQLKILKLIKDLAKEKRVSTIINTHYPNHALEVSDLALLLQKNKKHKIGKTSDVITKENIKDAFKVEVYLEEIQKDKTYKTIIPYKIVGD